MRNAFLFFLSLLVFAPMGRAQEEDRVILAGSRISIEKPANVLLSKHTTTIYIDSTIEFMVTEFPNVELVKEWMQDNTYPLVGPEIKESIELEVYRGEAKMLIAEFNSVKDILYSFQGDPTYGIMTACIYKRSDASIRQRAQAIIESMRVLDEHYVDWYSYLSFSYDQRNVMQLIEEKYITGMRFTPNGVLNDSLFNATNITVLQFPPAPSVKSSKDLLLVAISGQLFEMTINEVLFDGEITINEQQAYKFWGKCSQDGVDFELVCVAFFDQKSAVVLNCHIIDDEYQNDVYDFVDSVVLKRDGY